MIRLSNLKQAMKDITEDIYVMEGLMLSSNKSLLDAGNAIYFTVCSLTASADIDYRKSKEGKVSRVVTITWSDIDATGETE